MLPHVRQEALTKGTERKLHQLCYSRGDAGEMLKVRADYKLPKEEDGKYWQLHLVDSPGIEVPEDNLQGMLAVLIACHAIMGSQKVELPSHKKLLPDLDITEDEAEELIQTVIHLCTQSLMMTMLYHEVNGFEQYVLAKLLPDHAYIFKDEITTLNEGGILHEHETMTGDTHLLCKAHLNCYLLEAGLTEFPMEKFQIDGTSYTRLIRSLRLPQNDIKALPEDFFPSFPSLVEFDVSHNKLSILPKGIGKCKKLCGINVKKNNLQNLPEELLELKDQPLRLEISENPIHSLPEVICHLENLQRLLANNLLLTSLPENFGNLKNLNYLTLKHNCLQVLPSSFKNLKKLKSLSLEGFPWFKHKPNGFLSQEDFGEFLKGTYADKWLEMHKEDKASLYEFFDEDSNGLLDEKEIAKLNACLFHIFPRFRGTEEESGIPAEILELENLEYLDLQFQGITHIPDTISKLHKLQELVVSFNPCLETISPLAGKLPLKRLVLDECPSIRTPPKEIISKGFQTIYAYLRRLISGSVECKRTKLMLVGLGGVGKTSLVKAIMSGGGVGETQEAIPQVTDGIDICTWTVTREKETVSYSVWDFAGQTVYYNTHQFFLSDRAVYLLLWNIRQGHEHAGLDFWLNSIAVHAPKAPILVVGTHLDQVSKVEIPVEEMQQKYSQIKGFHFVSSHSGQGIKDLQEMLLDVTLEQPYIGEQIPQVWLNLEKEIIKLRTTESVVSYVSLEDLALTKSGIYDKSEVSQAVQFLHELGSLQHFDNNFLKSHVVINPQWIVDVMSCVVSVNDSHIKDGYFNHTDIPKVWEDYPADLHWWLLRLTEEYDLTFQLPDKPVNLVPCLLPEKQPHFDWPELDRENGEREAKMIYKFDYLPAGLFNRAQVRLYEFSDSSVIWKRGSRLKKNDHIALLTQFRDSELHVKVQGTTPENVLFLVHEVFEGLITESFQGVVYDYLMPCPDCSKAHARDPHMFSASSIRRATQLKAPFLQCTKYFHVIPLTDLHSMMPPESSTDYDLQLVQTVRGLTDLRKDMSADIFISYCAKDVPKKSEKRVAPVDVCRDLEEAGYRCWFQEDPSSQSLEVTAIALRDARVFLACISDNYIEDQDCCAMFKYACTTLRKSIVLVVLGDSMNWQTSQIGLLVAGEVYVNMQQKDKYTSKLEELAKKLDMNTLLKKDEAIDYPPVFISYAWANSARAVELGTPEKEGAAGFGDPRDYKDFLEKNGIKCWLDVEQVGANGLFEDIAVGLQNAKLVVACISDQYAESTNCNMEFRFAKTALNLPIIVVTVGRGQMWRKSEVGMLSINYPVVSHDDTDQLLKLVKENLPSEVQQPVSNETKEKKKEKEQANQQQKNTSFQELYELAQRKFLRQVAKLADSFNMEAYPRLVVIDHMATEETEEGKIVEQE
ncbi:probable serine/threonine-protein kinase pats1 [Lingula anatina]|uniref:non-specific serine/threonine protein kinase n=1 Tax=Lingula anatina TaxID=7574 RepID=A0A1S3IHX6_LINAN|nr:probable serine/threonine-protein kinase pats1 [Lingula anatina]|eukprot:XP_013397728.1 probable serine/threonine-protein kinase pats1 [Lingula anatina]